MKIRLVRSKVMDKLASSVEENLSSYRSGSFNYIEDDPSNYIEIEREFDEHNLEIMTCSETDHKEVFCCLIMDLALGSIPPYLARDPRLWVYLTHTKLLEYSRKRWPIPVDDVKAISHIKKHFFAAGARGIERDNAASRLWWMVALCKRVDDMSLEKALTLFLYQYDVRANIIERPTTSQSPEIFSAIIHKLNESYENDKKLFEREKFRSVMKSLNLKGGVKLLGALEDEQLEQIINSCLD